MLSRQLSMHFDHLDTNSADPARPLRGALTESRRSLTSRRIAFRLKTGCCSQLTFVSRQTAYERGSGFVADRQCGTVAGESELAFSFQRSVTFGGQSARRRISMPWRP